MKKKEIVLAAVIGWVAGPFTFVYVGKKSVLRAVLELLFIVAVVYLTHYLVAVVFVLTYSMLGAIAAKNYNLAIDRKEALEK